MDGEPQKALEITRLLIEMLNAMDAQVNTRSAPTYRAVRLASQMTFANTQVRVRKETRSGALS